MKFSAASISIMFLFGTAWSWITLQHLGNTFDEVFGQKNNLRLSIVNPVFGYVFMSNGCLYNIGRYSSEFKVAYDDKGKRDYLKDESEDSLTSLVLHLFSIKDGVFTLRTSESSFTKKYFIDNEAYDVKDPTIIDRKKNIEMLGKTFIRLLRGETITETIEEKTEVLTPFELFKKYVLTPSKVIGLSDTKLKLLVIHAYVLRLLTNLEDFKIYLKAISDGLLQRFEDKKDLPALCAEQKELFESFYKYNCLSFPYSQFKLPKPDSFIPAYSRDNDEYVENKELSDQNNIIALLLCNCLFYDDVTGRCSLAHLKSGNKKISPECKRLFEFYEKYKFMPFELTEEMRKDWSKVVHALPDVEEMYGNNTFTICYDDPEYKNVLTPGIFNYMYVLAKICGADKILIGIMRNVEYDYSEPMLIGFCNFLAKISLKEIRVDVNSSEGLIVYNCNANELFGGFYLSFNSEDKKTYVKIGMYLDKTQVDFKLISMKTSQEIKNLKPLHFLNSNRPRMFLSSLLYGDDKLHFFAVAFDNLYNQGSITTNEQKKIYLIHLFKFMEEYPYHKHVTKRIIENIIKSADLSDQVTRRIFKPFFVLFKDLFKTNEEIRETWMSLYTKNSDDELDVIRNIWIKRIKGLVEINELEIPDANSYSVNAIKIILDTVRAKLQVLRISCFQYVNRKQILEICCFNDKEQNEFSKVLGDFLKNNNTLIELTLKNGGLRSTENMKTFANGLKHAKSLKTLNIPHNYIGKAGAEILAKSLHKSIETLDISNNYLKLKGLGYLADALKDNEAFIFLDISHNCLRTKTKGIFLDVLSNFKHVKMFNISFNNLTVQNIQEFAIF